MSRRGHASDIWIRSGKPLYFCTTYRSFLWVQLVTVLRCASNCRSTIVSAESSRLWGSSCRRSCQRMVDDCLPEVLVLKAGPMFVPASTNLRNPSSILACLVTCFFVLNWEVLSPGRRVRGYQWKHKNRFMNSGEFMILCTIPSTSVSKPDERRVAIRFAPQSVSLAPIVVPNLGRAPECRPIYPARGVASVSATRERWSLRSQGALQRRLRRPVRREKIRRVLVHLSSVKGLVLKHFLQCGQLVRNLTGSDYVNGGAVQTHQLWEWLLLVGLWYRGLILLAGMV